MAIITHKDDKIATTLRERIGALLSRPPSDEAFSGLCEAVDSWPIDATVGELLQELTAALTTWPETARAAPAAWLSAVCDGRIPRFFALVRALTWHSTRALVRALDPDDEFSSETLDRARWAASLESPALIHLTDIDFSGLMLEDDDVRLFAGCRHLESLRRLSLRDNDITGIGAARLAEAPFLAQLDALDLYDNRLGDTGAHKIVESEPLRNAAARWVAEESTAEAENGDNPEPRINLDHNQIGPKGARRIADSHLSEVTAYRAECDPWWLRFRRRLIRPMDVARKLLAVSAGLVVLIGALLGFEDAAKTLLGGALGALVGCLAGTLLLFLGALSTLYRDFAADEHGVGLTTILLLGAIPGAVTGLAGGLTSGHWLGWVACGLLLCSWTLDSSQPFKFSFFAPYAKAKGRQLAGAAFLLLPPLYLGGNVWHWVGN